MYYRDGLGGDGRIACSVGLELGAHVASEAERQVGLERPEA